MQFSEMGCCSLRRSVYGCAVLHGEALAVQVTCGGQPCFKHGVVGNELTACRSYGDKDILRTAATQNGSKLDGVVRWQGPGAWCDASMSATNHAPRRAS